MFTMPNQSYRPSIFEIFPECDRHDANALNSASRDDVVPVVPKQNDILCGQPKTFAAHLGNIRYQQIIAREAVNYHRAITKQARMQMTQRIVTDLRAEHDARFLQLTTTANWQELTDVKARDKTSHALRQYFKKHQQILLYEAVVPDHDPEAHQTISSFTSAPKHQRMVSDEPPMDEVYAHTMQTSSADAAATDNQYDENLTMRSMDAEIIKDLLSHTVTSLDSLLFLDNNNTVRSCSSWMIAPLGDSSSHLSWLMEDVVLDLEEAANSTAQGLHGDPQDQDTMHSLQYQLYEFQEQAHQDHRGSSDTRDLQQLFDAPPLQSEALVMEVEE